MTDTELKDAIVRILARIAPEVRSQTLTPMEPLRDQLDLDSMDVLNFVIALHEEFDVDIPESEYAKLATLDGIVGYIAERRGERPSA